ncbi:YtcA family lipoprotein [Granulicella sp. dw_53]|uniref:YtcA family lipoprotein n=1 Tax=Granulicella sp. dw_53 TaxID=2719792 RepID=UPI001BD4E364|nr:YtcA family lipoprotein [Granulicella sp. dw_53]
MTRRTLILAQATCLLCAGCGRAPSVDIIGSFFPVWMLCLTIAIVLTCVLRVVLLRYQFESEIGPVALFYPSVVILLSCVLWLIFFR